jgi:AraC-like DNA-binding protein/quercetin dioxygenase-like cupin family protein
MLQPQATRAKFEKIIVQGEQSFYWHHSICKQFTAPYHFHPEFEIIHIRRGRGRRMVGDSIGHFGPGDLVFIAPNVPHVWKVAPECRETEALYIQFLPAFLGADFFKLPEMKSVMDWMAGVGAGLTFSAAVRGEMTFRFHRFPNLNKAQRLLELLDILCCLSRDSSSRPLGHALGEAALNSRDGQRMSQVFDYINQKLADPLSQAEIAQHVRLRPSAFSRLFKSATGKCFVQVVNELRIAQVCRLLVETDRTIAEIAFGCGFETLSHFNSRFRRTMKMVPRKYRELHQSARG